MKPESLSHSKSRRDCGGWADGGSGALAHGGGQRQTIGTSVKLECSSHQLSLLYMKRYSQCSVLSESAFAFAFNRYRFCIVW